MILKRREMVVLSRTDNRIHTLVQHMIYKSELSTIVTDLENQTVLPWMDRITPIGVL